MRLQVTWGPYFVAGRTPVDTCATDHCDAWELTWWTLPDHPGANPLHDYGDEHFDNGALHELRDKLTKVLDDPRLDRSYGCRPVLLLSAWATLYGRWTL